MISIRSLDKYFNKGKQNQIHVINNVSLDLPEKGMVAVFGKSGCGKTTLLNVIGGLDRFDGGELLLDGKDIRSGTDELRNRTVGYIFQNYNLNKSETCFENVANALRLCGMTDREEIEVRVMAALSNVGMAQFRSRLPYTLSGGQQQRIAIARAIVKNPPVILADEPTGNLDEANTVLVMDLLKEISRDHLVLLVTHEADLVDYYCDQVVELQDGVVKSVRNNAGANGYTTRDKNDIFLGELERSTASAGNAEIEYYGEKPQAPVKLRIVNNGGKIYLQLRSSGVQILDETSEVKLREGIYVHDERKKEQNASIDMSALPPVEGKRYGRLFTFLSSVKSGYNVNFHKRKKGKKLLQVCMGLFAAVLVFVSAVLGVSIQKLIKADRAYNHNVFYVYTPADGKVSERLTEAVKNRTAGIDFSYVTASCPTGDATVYFKTGSFETYQSSDMNDFSAGAVILEHSLLSEMTAVAGSIGFLRPQDVVITTAVADALLEKSPVGYINDYPSLIGAFADYASFSNGGMFDGIFMDASGISLTVNGQALRVSAVVKSSENAIYLSTEALAESTLGGFWSLFVFPASDYGLTVANGETLLVLGREEIASAMHVPGDKMKIHGMNFTVANVTLDKQCQRLWGYLVSDEDYIRLSRQFGETDPQAYSNYPYWKDEYDEKNDHLIDDEYAIDDFVINRMIYTVIHSSDPAATAEWLQAQFPDLDSGSEVYKAILTPADVYENLISGERASIRGKLIAIVIFLAVMSTCMYFIMRSALLSRVKEVGIYRAIGVSRKNLIFRFLVEAIVLTALTVLIGFLISSLVLAAWLGLSSLFASLFFYPLWYAALLFVVIVAVCLVCGTIPVVCLLLKTPSEILAKYDI